METCPSQAPIRCTAYHRHDASSSVQPLQRPESVAEPADGLYVARLAGVLFDLRPKSLDASVDEAGVSEMVVVPDVFE